MTHYLLEVMSKVALLFAPAIFRVNDRTIFNEIHRKFNYPRIKRIISLKLILEINNNQ